MRPILCAAFSLVLLLSSVSSAQGGISPPGGRAVPQALVDPHVVRLKVIDGDDIRFSKLPGAEGLSQDRVTQIVRDAQGFLWFATQHGLDRYDGYHFKVFKHDLARPDSLCGVFVTSLFEDRAGNLWMGCGDGLDRYDPLTETFVHYHLAWGPVPHWSDEVGQIHEDRDGKLWLSTGGGLARLDPRSGRTTWFHHNANDPLSLSDDDVKSSGEDREGHLWVATGRGLDEFDPNTGHVIFHVPLREPHELSFYEDREGVFWILSASGNGLAVLDRKTGRLTRYSFAARELPGLPLT
ncbi:MAG: ligand-binding sensor domain-containing protein, partial [Steroidobacteraceae bacterium]